MRNVVLNVGKFFFVVIGFFGAFAFVRGLSNTFRWHTRELFGGWFGFGVGWAFLWLVVCVGVLGAAVWLTKPQAQIPHRKIDFSFLVLLCAVGFAAAYRVLSTFPNQFNATMIIALPVAVYLGAVFIYIEFIARLRDKTIVKTLYWVDFFNLYPMWKPVGFFTALLLISQLYLLFNHLFFFPVRGAGAFMLLSPSLLPLLFPLFTIGAATYFAAFVLNLSTRYAEANAAHIQAERFKSELITNVSHDIKTPLTSIINYVDLLKNEDLRGTAAEYVQVLVKKSARLKSLIDDLMEASKAGTGNMPVNMAEINLSEIVGQIAGEFEDGFNEKGLTLTFRADSNEPVLIKADSRHLYRALENLFSNAAKYSFAGTRVFAEIEQKGGGTKFILQNTSESPLEMSGAELTEQFIRGDKSRRTDGNGLGLYIAKSLLELMGGKLNVTISGDLFRVEVVL